MDINKSCDIKFFIIIKMLHVINAHNKYCVNDGPNGNNVPSS